MKSFITQGEKRVLNKVKITVLRKGKENFELLHCVTCLSWLWRFLYIFVGFTNSVWWFRILVGGGSIKRMLWWETAWSGNSCGVFSLLIWISPPLPVSVKIFIMLPSVCPLQSNTRALRIIFPSWLDRVNENRNYLCDNRLQLEFFFLFLFYRKVGSRSLNRPHDNIQ